MKIRYIPMLFSVLCALLLSACGESSAPEEEPTAAIAPEAIAAEAFDLYQQALLDVVDIAKAERDVRALNEKLTALKEEYIQKLIVLGRKREELDDPYRGKVDTALYEMVSSLSPDLLEAYKEAREPYFGTEVGNLLMSFNNITRYANFDLLRLQEPEEAERLGIE